MSYQMAQVKERKARLEKKIAIAQLAMIKGEVDVGVVFSFKLILIKLAYHSNLDNRN